MAHANENLDKHLKLAIRPLQELSTHTIYSIEDMYNLISSRQEFTLTLNQILLLAAAGREI